MRKDLTGMKFGRLTALEEIGRTETPSGSKHYVWKCICECGKFHNATSTNLLGNRTQSCGCLASERIVKRNKAMHKSNSYEILPSGSVKVYYNNCDDYFLCDHDDWDNLKHLNWYKENSGYARTVDGKKKIQFHNLIIDCPDGMVTDHINRDRGDNRKENIRIVNNSVNMINRNQFSSRRNMPTGIRKSKSGKYIASIRFENKLIHLGTYDDIETAIEKRQEAIYKYHDIKIA